MGEKEFKGSLIEVIRLAGEGGLADGWMYLSSETVDRLTPTLFLPSSADMTDPEAYAARTGFPYEGLDTATLEDVVRWTERQLAPEPSDEELVNSFEYYWRFDAFLPALNAKASPSRETVLKELDRQFYGGLGEERSGTSCRKPDCDRGTIQFSVFCRDHHFENIKGRPWTGGEC